MRSDTYKAIAQRLGMATKFAPVPMSELNPKQQQLRRQMYRNQTTDMIRKLQLSISAKAAEAATWAKRLQSIKGRLDPVWAQLVAKTEADLAQVTTMLARAEAAAGSLSADLMPNEAKKAIQPIRDEAMRASSKLAYGIVSSVVKLEDRA